MRRNKHTLWAAIGFLAAFVLWTIAVRFIDVAPIGPNGSVVGFATPNRFIHNATGVHMFLYNLTDWLSLIPITAALSFAILGLVQWIIRKSLFKVDFSLLILGGFYIVVIAVYLFFESNVINHRPVLINGNLEASYPSSTTVLVICVMSTAIMQLNQRIRKHGLKRCVGHAGVVYIVIMIVSRLLSGVHWFSDIAGGILLSSGLVMLYAFLISLRA